MKLEAARTRLVQLQAWLPGAGKQLVALVNVTNVFALTALIVSLVTYNNTEQRRKRDLPAELIPKAFEKYYEMNKIQIDKWYLSHLFAVPARYAEVKSLIQQNMEGLTAAKKAEYLLHERSMADFVFTFSEQNLFQWDLTRDREREIINDVLGYLRGKLLRNPRLVYWWRESGAGLELSYNDKTRNDWADYVLAGSNTANFTWCDASGPFEIDAGPHARRSAFGSC